MSFRDLVSENRIRSGYKRDVKLILVSSLHLYDMYGRKRRYPYRSRFRSRRAYGKRARYHRVLRRPISYKRRRFAGRRAAILRRPSWSPLISAREHKKLTTSGWWVVSGDATYHQVSLYWKASNSYDPYGGIGTYSASYESVLRSRYLYRRVVAAKITVWLYGQAYGPSIHYLRIADEAHRPITDIGTASLDTERNLCEEMLPKTQWRSCVLPDKVSGSNTYKVLSLYATTKQVIGREAMAGPWGWVTGTTAPNYPWFFTYFMSDVDASGTAPSVSMRWKITQYVQYRDPTYDSYLE